MNRIPSACSPLVRLFVRRRALLAFAGVLALYGSSALASPAESAATQPLPTYLADRGIGIPTSQFAVFVEPGEWIVYPFYEYTRTPKFEYHPSELGSVGGTDYNGKLFEHEALLFVAYGISNRVSIEFEGALYAKTEFEKAKDDPSNLPTRLRESGLGDVEGQIRWRWQDETARRPELYSYFEAVLPLQKNKLLIGTQDWEGALGIGFLRGHSWGTLGGRIAVAWDGADSRGELGEYAIEYIKQTHNWRFYAALEGESVEVSFIGEAQRKLGPHAILKLNCGVGLTELSPDIAPEVGVLFHF